MTREEAIKIIDCYDIGFYDLSGAKIPANKLADAFDMAIEALQSEPAKHGEWKKVKGADGGYTDFRCSNCRRYRFHNGEMLKKYLYCPNCGAKMDKE